MREFKKRITLKAKIVQQNVPQKANLSFSGILKHFAEIEKKHLFKVKKCFSHQNELHRAQHSFPDILNFFAESDKKTSL